MNEEHNKATIDDVLNDIEEYKLQLEIANKESRRLKMNNDNITDELSTVEKEIGELTEKLHLAKKRYRKAEKESKEKQAKIEASEIEYREFATQVANETRKLMRDQEFLTKEISDQKKD